MADRITQTNELKMLAEFDDKDTRTVSVDDPRADLTKLDIKSVETTLKNTNAIIGDKAGAAFTRFSSAKTLKKKTTQLDLTLE